MKPDERRARIEFVRRVKLRMKALDINQSDFAGKIGSAHSAVSELLDEDGTVWPAAYKLFKMPKALKCNMHWLVSGDGPEAPPSSSGDERYFAGYLDALAAVEGLIGPLGASARARLLPDQGKPAGQSTDRARRGAAAREAADQKDQRKRG